MNPVEKSDKDLLRLEGISSGYSGVRVLHDISMRVKEGDSAIIVGPNGAGKTTLMRTIMGIMVDLFEGEVYFEGEEIGKAGGSETVEKGLNMVPQEGKIFPSLTVDGNLEMGGLSYEGDVEERREEVYELFPRLEERSNQIAGSLSGGERQMLAIGRALMVEPKMLLLDEPTSGLQPSLVDSVGDKIQTLKDMGVPILMSTQVRSFIDLGDKVFLIEAGEIVERGSDEEMIKSDGVQSLYPEE